jgi:hypothetical protein
VGDAGDESAANVDTEHHAKVANTADRKGAFGIMAKQIPKEDK